MNEWRRLKKSFGYALAGIQYTVKTQRNMQIHVIVAILVLLSGFWLQIPRGDVLLVFFSVFLVLIMETINTAVEKVVDLAANGKVHPLAKVAKDVAAGAVLFSAILAACTGFIVYAEPLWQFVNGARIRLPLDERGGWPLIIVSALLVTFLLWIYVRRGKDNG
ncbi:diacylglycerol kinase family protein [Aneurinibacillus sp. Ricciae_BoGa-3]|uniref:diacylglycerol kinase family protein n=1 Tax=Aneurinibacillus sp. Ricciae_BoGa-3 TaxID=3022697 RepID=UPI00233FC375|nr:diacylglycerol kinase family protein [Aneurinibacillus sp. Ricciae_BoGa-3]WCK53464.1 diacylglycerol kinase family protein [Aneurinibacillus sp. Ricciae_BoGa-3]